ncbi:DUF5959 family protein [Amycolatopsis sp. NPDC059021]|uniref:DUF5959 family protein n=1 Tax=Amycolatopsis sp. NPDC059021 TaxID=3346704 RepID=UPI00366BE31D
MAGEPIDLIHLGGEGNSVALRIRGTYPGSDDLLDGELRIDTAFVTGRLQMWLAKDTLDAWRDALDVLDAGEDVVWDTGTRGPMVSLGHEEFGRVAITVRDPDASGVGVTVPVPLDDAWFDDAYDRLDRVWRAWFGSA